MAASFYSTTIIGSVGTSNVSDDDGECIWTINSEEAISAISQANNGDQFSSKLFSIGKISWEFRLHPNGQKPQEKGSCIVGLGFISIEIERAMDPN